jgi:hypothetical protein
MKRLIAALALALSAPTAHAAGSLDASCRATQQILPKTNLTELAEFWFGDQSYRWAIMLATNARTSNPIFPYIGDPARLGANVDPGAKGYVCIPELLEANTLRNRFSTYLEAVEDTAVAEPSEEVTTLDPITPGQNVTVATWLRGPGKLDEMKAGEAYTTGDEMWVTLAPHLQEFCKDYVQNHSDTPDEVTLRLEQRLGLPPNAGKTIFAEFELTIKDPKNITEIFRPCGDWEVTDRSCQAGIETGACPSGDALCAARKAFLYRHYYRSFGRKRPVQYPWTGLGYTFDWARGPIGQEGKSPFVVVGVSEYVIPAGQKIVFKRLVKTADYCGF